MAATDNDRVTAPLEVAIGGQTGLKFTPSELAIVKERTGRSLMQILQDEETDEKFTVMAWLRLRRDGHDIDYDDMGNVIIDIGPGEPPDPTSAMPSTIWPNSAGSGA